MLAQFSVCAISPAWINKTEKQVLLLQAECQPNVAMSFQYPSYLSYRTVTGQIGLILILFKNFQISWDLSFVQPEVQFPNYYEEIGITPIMLTWINKHIYMKAAEFYGCSYITVIVTEFLFL